MAKPRRKTQTPKERAETKAWGARETILQGLPENVQDTLRVEPEGPGLREFSAWQQNMYRRVAEAAEVYEDTSYWFAGTELAFCPLCSDGARHPGRGTIGWRHPTGLMWHLEGKGQARRCRAMEKIEEPFLRRSIVARRAG